jgi:ABC-type Fe3+/spermidine/putrescine transport system ATPase subunit
MVAIDTLSKTAARDEILTLHGVNRGFPKGSGEVLVLADVDLSLQGGEIVGLLGRSGSGKSTLLRIIAGLIRPSSGDVVYCGEPVKGPAGGYCHGVPDLRPVPVADRITESRGGARGAGGAANGEPPAGAVRD